MPTALREAALAAIADRLSVELPGIVLERARRAPVDTDKEQLPRLVLTGTDWEADETAEPGSTHYTAWASSSPATYGTPRTSASSRDSLICTPRW